MACNAFHTYGILTRDGLAPQDAAMAGLAYKMKACHSINQRLASTDDYLSDTLIAAVHLLLSAEVNQMRASDLKLQWANLVNTEVAI